MATLEQAGSGSYRSFRLSGLGGFDPQQPFLVIPKAEVHGCPLLAAPYRTTQLNRMEMDGQTEVTVSILIG